MKYPKGIKAVYDNGGISIDRYTIYFNNTDCVVSGLNPYKDFYRHGTGRLGKHNGVKINWRSLPEIVKFVIKQELKNCI